MSLPTTEPAHPVDTDSLAVADIVRHRIVPVIVCSVAASAGALGDALVAGGLPVAEVTFRTPAAAGVIEALAARGDVLVGAGTVLTTGQVATAVAAGARFVVSPGLDVDVVRRCQELGVPVLPGAVTPSEIMAALRLGLRTLKFFPAGIYGGAAALAALSAPFGGVRFIPTGGVGPGNVADYLSLPCVPAVGGSWMVPADAVDAGDVARLTSLVRDATAAVGATGAREEGS